MCDNPEIERTDMRQLALEIRPGNYKDALPSRLSKNWLIRIVRDFRMMEAEPSNADHGSYASAGIYLVGLILVGLTTAKELPKAPGIPVDIVIDVLSKYHQLAEREIVSRQLGISNESSENEFIQFLDQLVASGGTDAQ